MMKTAKISKEQNYAEQKNEGNDRKSVREQNYA
jgi:hypothetical protein